MHTSTVVLVYLLHIHTIYSSVCAVVAALHKNVGAAVVSLFFDIRNFVFLRCHIVCTYINLYNLVSLLRTYRFAY